MTPTVTQVMYMGAAAAPPQYEVLRLRLQAREEDKRPIQERVASLVETLRASEHLSEEEKGNLAIWANFKLPQFEPQADGSTPEDLADNLCSLLVKFVRPLIEEGREDEAADEGVDLQANIKQILRQILPSDVDVYTFIRQYEGFEEEFSIKKEAKELVAEGEEEILEEEEDRLRDRSGERFYATRDAIQAAILRREERADGLDAVIVPLIAQADAALTKSVGVKAASEAQIVSMREQLGRARAQAARSIELFSHGAIDSL